jgi:hypothetical protein
MPADQLSRNTCGACQAELIDRVAISRWKSPWVAQEAASPRDSFMQLASHPDIGFVVRRASMGFARGGLHERDQRVRDVPQGGACIPGNLSSCASSSTTSSPGNLRRGQPNEEGKPNECGAGSDQRVGKIAVSCSEPIPDLLERIHHRLSEGWSAMPCDSADRIACEAARCWPSVRMTPLGRGSGVR